MSDFCGSLAIKFLACDDVSVIDPKVKVTFLDDCINSQKMSVGTFNLEFKDRGQTSENVLIQLYDGETLVGYCKMKAVSLMKGTLSMDQFKKEIGKPQKAKHAIFNEAHQVCCNIEVETRAKSDQPMYDGGASAVICSFCSSCLENTADMAANQ